MIRVVEIEAAGAAMGVCGRIVSVRIQRGSSCSLDSLPAFGQRIAGCTRCEVFVKVPGLRNSGETFARSRERFRDGV